MKTHNVQLRDACRCIRSTQRMRSNACSMISYAAEGQMATVLSKMRMTCTYQSFHSPPASGSASAAAARAIQIS